MNTFQYALAVVDSFWPDIWGDPDQNKKSVNQLLWRSRDFTLQHNEVTLINASVTTLFIHTQISNYCFLADNSSISTLGQIVQVSQGSYLYQTALTAAKFKNSNNDELMVTVWHATNGNPTYDQLIGSIFSKNGKLVSGNNPFGVSNLARQSNPTISKRITVSGNYPLQLSKLHNLLTGFQVYTEALL